MVADAIHVFVPGSALVHSAGGGSHGGIYDCDFGYHLDVFTLDSGT